VFGRRLLILVAVLLGVATLASTVAPPAPRTPRDGTAAPSGTPEAPRSGVEADGRVVEATIDAAGAEGAGGAFPPVRARVGDTVVVQVTSDVIDTVAIEELAVDEQVEPDVPATLEVVVETAGTYPVRLLDADREIGELQVAAAGADG
jgi:hypothetical protein